MDKVNIGDLEVPDKIEILKHLATDSGNEINLEVFDAIAHSNLPEFIKFCDKVFAERVFIDEIYVSINDNVVEYHIRYV